jgi:DNA-binding HxlR family transcriptional regulator
VPVIGRPTVLLDLQADKDDLQAGCYARRVSARSYEQVCGLARALDVLGDRWTLLVVRELVRGPKRYRDLQDALPGIGTNLLAARLRTLVEHGIAERTVLPPPAGVPVYELTARGEALRPALQALALWGFELVPDDPTQGTARAAWAAMTMAAHLEAQGGSAGTVLFEVGDERFHLRGTEVRDGAPAGEPDLVVRGELLPFLAVASGRVGAPEALRSGALEATDRRAAERLLEAFRLPVPA